MKVDKQKFIEMLNYMIKIDECDLKDLDLSEFENPKDSMSIKEWKFTGLSNKCYIELELLPEE